MPIMPPRLDDRNFNDLVEELIARVPAHTPEWVPQAGDPGRTLLELFAWLGDALLYRVNLIPERQRLAFLNLLGAKMRAARAAQGIVSVFLDEPDVKDAVTLATQAKITGPVNFETLSELTVLPVTAECYYKRPLSTSEETDLSDVLDGLRSFHEIQGTLKGYVTTPLFVNSEADFVGLDVVQDTTDKSLWVALFAAAPGLVEDVKKTLAGIGTGTQQLINIGIAPTVELPESFDDMEFPGRIPHVWEISTPDLDSKNNPVYSQLTVYQDDTNDMTKRGVQRLILPGNPQHFGTLEGDVRVDANAGVGDRPPRLDDPKRLARLVAWLRLRPMQKVTSMSLSWLGINAVSIDQRETITARVVGQSNATIDQVFQLPVTSVELDSFELQVEEAQLGYVGWQRVDDLAVMGRDDAVYTLDSEAGMVQFGNGLYGRIPEYGRRIRVAQMRAGGGSNGNLPIGSLKEISAKDVAGNQIKRKLKVMQSLATEGGADAETLSTAEKRIPSWLQHRNRSVTEQDYKALAAETPGVRVGRIEILSRFIPHQRRSDVPGVVSVMVLPYKQVTEPPNPRPDQPFIEKVYSYLNTRRPLATELYVIGCEYIPVGISIGISVRDGFGHEQTIYNVREAVKHYLWCFAPHGPYGEGWPLGKTVSDREVEVEIARVAGVNTVGGVNLFVKSNNAWSQLPRVHDCDPVTITLEKWQLPELLSIVVTTDGEAAEDLSAVPNPFDGGAEGGGVAVPVVPEVC